MNSMIVRILLRYLAGFLVAKGLFSADDSLTIINDPDIQMLLEIGLGMGISSISEIWFWLTNPSKEAVEVGKAVDEGKKVTIEGPRGGETIVQKTV